jgi:hypothetical protein
LASEQDRKQRALDKLTRGVLRDDDYVRLDGEITSRIADLEDLLYISESNDLDVDSATEYLKHLLWNTSIVWQTASFAEKTSIQRRLFPQGLRWVGNGFGTP